jgi:hypothetical protein
LVLFCIKTKKYIKNDVHVGVFSISKSDLFPSCLKHFFFSFLLAQKRNKPACRQAGKCTANDEQPLADAVI